ncbi:MAG: nitrogenase component 1 [Elusimicrobiota bacterium]|jgi:nitrogenase molybdenum-iron protein alpha/beta subunit
MRIEDVSTPMNFPTLLGVYLAVNAISDAYILVDGPDCTLYKAHFIHGRHDLQSSLLSITGQHRVLFTNVCSRGVVKEHDALLRRHLLTLGGLKESGLVLVTALPMCSITGVDYGRVLRSLKGKLAKTSIDIPPDSLVGDWLDGYDQAMASLARGLGLAKGRASKGRVALVGHLMDRNEADQQANVVELKRMVAALGLETVSVWLDGGPAAALKAAERAGLVVSLPYGRLAGRRIAETTGAKLVEAELPFGLVKTQSFLRQVGKAAGKSAQAEAFIEAELSRVVPRLQWLAPQRFLGKTAAFMGDPYLLDGFLDIAEDLGMRVTGAVSRGRAAHGAGLPKPEDRHPGVRVLREPPVFSQEVRDLMSAPKDLFVSCWCEREWPSMENRALEFGFPSYRHHALFDRPFLGFNGMLGFVERMSDALSQPRSTGSRR